MRHYILLLLLALLGVGCNDTSLEPAPEELCYSTPAQIYSDIDGSTRVAGANWEAGDAIGLFMTYYLNPNILDGRSNISYTTVSGDGYFTPTVDQYGASTPLYYPHSTASVDMYAYYPYRQLPNGGADIPIDLSSQEDLSAIDFMSASISEITNSDKNNPVHFSFNHRLSKLTINIVSGDGISDVAMDGMVVTLASQTTTASYNLIDGEMTEGDDNVAITMNKRANGDGSYTLAAVILPQSFDDSSIVNITLSDSEIFTLPLHDYYSSGISEGQNISFESVTINRKGLEVSSPEIIGWDATIEEHSGTSVVYDYVIYDEDDFIDFICAGNSYSSLDVILMNNITITDKSWYPISLFVGTFNGNGKSISGLEITTSDVAYTGLFSAVGDGIHSTEVKDLTIVAPNITAGYCAGAIAGISYNSTFTNCAVKGGIVSGMSHAGGIVGEASSTLFFNCTNSSTSDDGAFCNPIAGSLRDGSTIY